VHDNPEATDAEQEEAHEGRLEEEDAMRYPLHEDPDEASDRSGAGSDEE
jgi:hypothetical protein